MEIFTDRYAARSPTVRKLRPDVESCAPLLFHHSRAAITCG